MAQDQNILLSSTVGWTSTATTGVLGPIVDLGSASVVRYFIAELRVGTMPAAGKFDVLFQDSTNSSSTTGWNWMYNGSTAGATGMAAAVATTDAPAVLGFQRVTTQMAASEFTAGTGPYRMPIKTDKRYIRAAFVNQTSQAATAIGAGVTLTLIPIKDQGLESVN